MPLHARALDRLRELAEGVVPWGLPVFCIGEFVRIVSHPRLFQPPTPATEALASVAALLASPSARLLVPADGYWPLFQSLVSAGGVSGNLVFDAQIAAVCLEGGARSLLTSDRDFLRFPGLEPVLLS
jgi:toxin-antitoxin system PIN domain toxin